MFQDNQHYICFGFKKHVSSELKEEIEELSRQEILCHELIQDFTVLLETYIVKMQCLKKEQPMRVKSKEDFRQTVCDFNELLGQQVAQTVVQNVPHTKFKAKVDQRHAFQNEVINRIKKSTLAQIASTLHPATKDMNLYRLYVNRILPGSKLCMPKLTKFLVKQHQDEELAIIQEFLRIAIAQQLSNPECWLQLTERLNLQRFGRLDVMRFIDDLKRHIL